MYLIVGLGNIGNEYKNTRHNIGFDAVDVLAEEYKININRVKFKGTYGEGRIGVEKIIILKPSTYMNLSGDSVRLAMDYYNIDSDKVVVLYDDVSLSEGKVRIRAKGSAGGHNGIKDIINKIGTDKFPRVKIGVGSSKGDMASYVLGKFSKEERKTVDSIIGLCPEIVSTIVKEGCTEAMNKFNGIVFEKEV